MNSTHALHSQGTMAREKLYPQHGQSVPPSGVKQEAHRPRQNEQRQTPPQMPGVTPPKRPIGELVLRFITTHRLELAAASLLIFAFLLLFSLLSYSPQDYANAKLSLSENSAETAPNETTAKTTAPKTESVNSKPYTIENWLGYIGVCLAHFCLHYTVGYGAFLFPCILMFWALAIFKKSLSDRLILGTALLLVGMTIFAGIAGVVQLMAWSQSVAWIQRPEWSGSVGQMIARILWHIIGTFGALFILILAAFATGFFALDMNIERSLLRMRQEIQRFRSLREEYRRQKTQRRQPNDQTMPVQTKPVQQERHTGKEQSPDYEPTNVAPVAPQQSPAAPVTQSPFHNNEDDPARFLRQMASNTSVRDKRKELLHKYEATFHEPEDTLEQEEVRSSRHHVERCAEDEWETINRKKKIQPPEPQSINTTIAQETQDVQGNVPAPPPAMPSGAKHIPTVNVSAAQTTVVVPPFFYPASASLCFVPAETQEPALNSEHFSITEQKIAEQPTMERDILQNPLRSMVHGEGKTPEVPTPTNTERTSAIFPSSANQNEISQTKVKTELPDTEPQMDEHDNRLQSLATFLSSLEQQSLIQPVASEVLTQEKKQQPEPILDEPPIYISTCKQLDAMRETGKNAATDAHAVLDEDLYYQKPTVDLLMMQEDNDEINEAELRENARLLTEKLRTFRIEIENLTVTPGPVVTQYEFVPAAGIKVSQIEGLADDIALALKARGIRIVAPVPGRGTVAVEIPNHKPSMVRFRSIVDSDLFRDTEQKLPLALGKTIHGDVYNADLAKMPHLLIAGSTGSGKSVGINSILVSLLYKLHPRYLKFAIVDPKKIEMTQYRPLLKHFLAVCPDIDETIVTNPQNAVILLKSVEAEMERRYDVLAKVGQRNIADYNQKVAEGRYKDTSDIVHREMPYIVVIIDELADLMMTASREVEEPICRLAQLARAVGIHLVVATQRPSVDVVTGLIKANFPARIAYQVASKVDSRTILDMSGAEHLLGNGDMLFMPGGSGKPIRLQNSFLSTEEVEKICEFISAQDGYSTPYQLPSVSGKSGKSGSVADIDDRDEMFDEAAHIVVKHQQGSVSLLQRRLKIGYSRAARIVDQLEEAGIVGPFDGSKGRSVLIESEVELDSLL